MVVNTCADLLLLRLRHFSGASDTHFSKCGTEAIVNCSPLAWLGREPLPARNTEIFGRADGIFRRACAIFWGPKPLKDVTILE